jgi:predicted transcriptional regulator
MTGDLFERHLRVVALTPDDADLGSDVLEALRRVIVECEPQYALIAKWFSAKVLPGLRSGERGAYLGYAGDQLAVVGITKRGERAKICHLRVREDFKCSGVGEFFFALLLCDVRPDASEVHFTLPESLWEQRSRFFSDFGFDRCDKARSQYRAGDSELRCVAPIELIWPRLLSKLSVKSMDADMIEMINSDAVLMTLKPSFCDAILHGRKTVEIRRRFSDRWLGSKVLLYAAEPVGKIVGEATIDHVSRGRPEQIWDRWSLGIGCSRCDYDAYTRDCQDVFALSLTAIRSLEQPMEIEQLSQFLGRRLRPPQSYLSIKLEAWSRALRLTDYATRATITPTPSVETANPRERAALPSRL